jgi:hypothetical protein
VAGVEMTDICLLWKLKEAVCLKCRVVKSYDMWYAGTPHGFKSLTYYLEMEKKRECRKGG